MSRPLHIFAFILVIGFSALSFGQNPEPDVESSEVENALSEPMQEARPSLALDPMEMESRKKICNCIYASSVPYKERRGSWGSFYGVQAGTYAPTRYQPDYSAQNYDQYYGSPGMPLTELVFGFKKHAGPISLGLQFSGGIFNEANDSTGAALSLYPVTGALLLAFDAIGSEPYVVPYGMFGGYTVFYKESVGGLSVQGNTPVATFFAGGLMFQLNAMDLETAREAYEEYGLENTFVYVEARQFMASAQATPDMSTNLHFQGGFKLEF